MGGNNPCKIVTVLVGDNPHCSSDIDLSLKMDIPVIVLEGSTLSNALGPDSDSKELDKLKVNKKEHFSLLGKS
jgi:hypothetical protein